MATELGPKAIGPYSQAQITPGGGEKTVYVSGNIGFDPTTSKMVEGGVQAQTQQALTNIDNILKAAGTSRVNVTKCTVYVTVKLFYTFGIY